MAVIKSQKSGLFYASAATTATQITCPTNIEISGGAADQIDATCLNDTTRQNVQGLKNAAQVTINFNVHSGDDSHEALLALKESGEIKSWGVYGSEAATAPTAVGSEMQPVVDRSSLIFDGYVSDVSLTIAGNDIWKGTVVLQTSGAITYDLLASS
jgi:tRNA (Thr-GGU) A37 N-methylase